MSGGGECRNGAESSGGSARDSTRPLWLGESDIAGKTILISAEQGLGDTIQFCRYATLAADAGAHVIVERVQPSLTRLAMASLRGVPRVISRGEPLPEHDLRCPMMSLPLAFGTEMGSIPAEVPYLRAPAGEVSDWQVRLSGLRGRRIGLVWGAGSRVGDSELVALRAPEVADASGSPAPACGSRGVRLRVDPTPARPHVAVK